MMQGLAFVGVIALATVLWAIASTMNARRARSLGPINREHFETAEPVDAAPTIPVRAAGEWLATGSHWGEGRNFGPTDGTVAEQMVERPAISMHGAGRPGNRRSCGCGRPPSRPV